MTARPPVFSPGLAEALYEQLHVALPGLSVEIVQSCDSTNTRLLERARMGDTSACLLVAGAQTAGRGRMGRQWQGEPGDCLMFSMTLPLAPRSWSGLSLVVGLELATALHPDIRIKWPNDLWLNNGKLGGILIETANAPGLAEGHRQVVIGCGINIAALPPAAQAGLHYPAAYLQSVCPALGAGEVLCALARPLLDGVLAFARQGFAPWQERFAHRDALQEREVQIIENGQITGMGRASGVNSCGELLMHTWEGMKAITSGEVSVRPQ
jgi:BirA family transcriptional regulator, biotin operon repressor / biotin---[acetyl-CoA-carboxylase] ligase